MDRNFVEEIMKNYNEELEKLNKTDKEFNIKVNQIKLHIERLEQEQREYTDGTGELYNEYDKKIKESEKELNDLLKTKSVDRIEKEKEKKQAENDLKDKALKDLTMNRIKLEKEAENKEFERQSLLHDISNFTLEYDDEHRPINGSEQRKLWDNLHKLQDEINEIKESIKLSEKYINEIKEVEKENEVSSNNTKTTSTKTTETKTTEANANDTKTEPNKAEKVKNDSSTIIVPEPTKSKENEKKELSEEDKIAMEEMKKTAELEKKEELNDVNIISYTSDDGPTISYKKGDKEFSRTAIYKYDDKMVEIKKILSKINPKIDFESEDGKNELKKYEKADFNIVDVLKNNPERLQEYIDLLNGEIEQDTEDAKALKISYDIRKLNKAKISKEEKKELETIAYEHRDIADVKTTFFQKIKFAFRGFKDRMNKSKEQKLLEAGQNKDISEESELDSETKKAIEKGIKEKHANKENTENKSYNFKDEYKVPVEVSKKIDEIAKNSTDAKEINFADKYDELSK